MSSSAREKAMDKKALFVTIPFSHYCEKARWAMDRVGFLYHEGTHLPGFHILANALRGSGAAVPYFKIGSFVVQDSTDILQYIDAAVSATSRLYPSEQALRRECDDLEELCDSKLGPATRQLWFFHVLRDRDYSLRVMRLSGPRLERMLIPRVFSTVRDKISRKYDINAAGASLFPASDGASF
jgi:glutathione S-transferase